MYEPKQQKAPASRTISTPAHRGVQQFQLPQQHAMQGGRVAQRITDINLSNILCYTPNTNLANNYYNGVISRSNDSLNEAYKNKFPNLSARNIPYEAGKICFTDYKDDLVSVGFDGCIMVVFEFNPQYLGHFKKIIPNLQSFNSYVAHVSTDRTRGGKDTKEIFAKLIRNDYIIVKAMFQPYRKDIITEDDTHEISHIGKGAGAITKIRENYWIATSSLFRDIQLMSYFCALLFGIPSKNPSIG